MEPARERAQLAWILASAAFSDAERASSFLRFIVERALDGRASEIKESVIAVEALGRSSSFDSKTDPIVRVEARRLRDRLSAYYASEGRADAILISVPKGAYVPEFSERHVPDESRLKTRRFVSPLTAWVLFGLALFGLVGVAAGWWWHWRKPAERRGTVRLSILPPDGTAFESFAVSPDGRKLAFTAIQNGQMMLWVRALDALDAKALAGTESASYPFWSPDSRSVGFFTPSKLKVIDTSSGPPRDVADAVVGFGGAWNAEGTIVFSPRPLVGLCQVAVSGGPARPVTSLDASRGEVSHRFPVFLPDGRHFLYLAASSRPGESSIRMGSLDSSTSKVLVSADTSAAYAPVLGDSPSSLLFVSGDGSLIVQRLDVRHAALSGERTVVVPQIRYERWHSAGFSVSGNGVVLYQNGAPENHRFAWFDRRGKLLRTFGPRNNYLGFSLSPDEKRAAILRHDDPATVLLTVWMMDLSHEGAISRMSDTAVGEPDFSPVWSPDGREVLFSRGDDRRMRLLIQAPNGGPAKPVLNTDGPKFPTDWSSDGRLITFSSQWPDYRRLHTWTMALGHNSVTDGPRAFLQHSYDEFNATFAPAGPGKAALWIAYTSDETGRQEVYVRDFPAGDHKWQISTQGGGLPHWRRDGRELFYLTLDGTLMAVPVSTAERFAYGTPQALFATGLRPTPTQTYTNQYAVSRDGQRFLFNPRVQEISASAITAVIPW